MKKLILILLLSIAGCAPQYHTVPVFCCYCWYDGPMDVLDGKVAHGEICPICKEGRLLADDEIIEKEKWAKHKNRDKKVGPSYYLLQLNKNSRLFTQTVLDAFQGGVIEPTQASYLLNVKVNKFSKLEAQLYK